MTMETTNKNFDEFCVGFGTFGQLFWLVCRGFEVLVGLVSCLI